MPTTSNTPSPEPALPRSNRGRRFPAEVLSPAEIARLIDACSRTAPTGLRNRALIVVMWRAGLRVSEALALMPKDVDRASGTLHVLNGKGGKPRMVALDPPSFSVIERWLDARNKLKRLTQSPVFCTLHGLPIQTAYVRALLPRLAESARIEKRVHAHALRHTFACELMREKFPINLIQKQLGHANLAVTSRYLQHVTPPELAEAMQRRILPSEVTQALDR
ncbi:MAG: tyrosine-type recombinase/integrase [Planctomycetota bacterium]